MKRIALLSAPLLALVVAFAANADPKAGAEARSVPAFQAIELAGTIEVDVAIGKPLSVQVTGEPDLLDQVLTTVKDGVLVVDTRRELRRRNHLRVSVTAPELTSISLSGTGAMKVTGLANERFAIGLPGTGTVTAAGSTGSLRVVVDGTGDVVAKELAAKAATIEVNGTGQATLRVSESLDARVTGTGGIDVHGRPAKVKKSVTGVGNIRIR